MIRAVAVGAAVWGAVTAAGAGTPCPPVALIHGTGDPSTSFNLVFVPSGFDKSELPLWRCAAKSVLDGLLTLEPFVSHSCAISAHRIDFSHCETGTPRSSTCGLSVTTCGEKPPVWGGLCANASSDAAFGPDELARQRVSGDLTATDRLSLDLGVTLCGDNPYSCQLLGIDAEGEAHVRQVASCAPAPDVIVVVANSGNVAGFETPGGSPLIVGITLDGIQAGTPFHLLAHELGHAFGLADEYGHGEGPDWACGMNLFFESTTSSPGCSTVPWSAECTTAAALPADGCPTTTNRDGCTLHGNVTDGCADCDDPEPPIGLWEGASYSTCGRYRPAKECRMGDVITNDYCQVCRGIIEDELAGLEGCLEVATRLYRTDIRPIDVDQSKWEIVCEARGLPRVACEPPDFSTFDVVEFRAEFERDGIRYVGEIDRLIVRDPETGPAWEWRRSGLQGRALALRRPPRAEASPAARGLERRLAKGPVKLPPDAVLAIPRGMDRPIPVRRAWIVARNGPN
jgi:hypothetical protein